ncbi:hypothetical protein [Patulibacter minatonensis]|uniref:hypothetical protein n=1 Tax=Patulibacter minatonensis TaxID=298163 RepID=UPI000687DF91|nr:hypothetical protein [Patulibacter minatonensis]
MHSRYATRWPRVAAVAATALVVAALPALTPRSAGAADRGNVYAGCRILPADSPWNTRVDKRPVDPMSSAYIASAGSWRNLSWSYGTSAGSAYALPVNVAGPTQPAVDVPQTMFHTDPGPYPIPSDVRVQPGSDRHVVIVQRGTCRLFELYHARREDGRWQADSGAIWDLTRNEQRPGGRTSANAAGLPVFPGVLNQNDARRRTITHALGVTLPEIQDTWVPPASHSDGKRTESRFMPMGTRLRLRSSFRLSRLPRQARIIGTALKRYGLIVTDTSGTPDNRQYDGVNIDGEASRYFDEASRLALYGLHLRDFVVVRHAGPQRRLADLEP